MYTEEQKQRFTVIDEQAKRKYLRIQRQKAARKRRFYSRCSLLLLIMFFIFGTAHITNANTREVNRGEVFARNKYFTSIQIEAGTSLWDIAEEYRTEEYESAEDYIREVKRINHMKSDLVYGGSYLCIPYYSAEEK